jgi:hypothetical protein
MPWPVLATGLAILATSAAPGQADETFLCADGTSVTITNENRAAMQEHPCVKAWFADDLAQRQARAGESEGRGRAPVPAVHRTTPRAAQAARDIRSRPGYVLWSRSRTASSASKDETSTQPRRRFRLRFGRR